MTMALLGDARPFLDLKPIRGLLSSNTTLCFFKVPDVLLSAIIRPKVLCCRVTPPYRPYIEEGAEIPVRR